jgi:hypothetical protein
MNYKVRAVYRVFISNKISLHEHHKDFETKEKALEFYGQSSKHKACVSTDLLSPKTGEVLMIWNGHSHSINNTLLEEMVEALRQV